MVEQLLDSIDIYHEGDKAHFINLLNRVALTKDYKVDLACTESFSVRGTRFNDKIHIKISNVDGFEIRVFKADGTLQCEFCHYYLMTDEEMKAESEAEIEAERVMSAWACGYRPHLEYMDDPRGE